MMFFDKLEAIDSGNEWKTLVLPRSMDAHPESMDEEIGKLGSGERLRIEYMNQKGLEYFVAHHGKRYRALSFVYCISIDDLSPLGDLENLEAVGITYGRTERLWNMERNRMLKVLSIDDSRRLMYFPQLLDTSSSLENVAMSGNFQERFLVESLEIFTRVPRLRSLSLFQARLKDRCLDYLGRMPRLEEFHFNYNMLTTEEIARICAKYPHLTGDSLCAYKKGSGFLNVQICGERKPRIQLGTAEARQRLEKYVRNFEKLVNDYREDIRV